MNILIYNTYLITLYFKKNLTQETIFIKYIVKFIYNCDR